MYSTAGSQPAVKASDFESIDDNLLGPRSVELQLYLTPDVVLDYRIEPADNLDYSET